jgi:hypothetical protein
MAKENGGIIGVVNTQQFLQHQECGLLKINITHVSETSGQV